MDKTCGNCANYDDDNNECVYCSYATGEEIHEQHEPTDKACEDWEECAYDIEQRYEQLEQVAKELYGLCESLMEIIADVTEQDDVQRRAATALGAVSGAGQVMSHAEDQLKALGVEV